VSLANYTDLQNALVGFSKRSDLTSQLPDFIALAESRIARDLRLRKQIVTTTLSTVAGTQYVTAPSDFLEAENFTVNTSPPRPMSVVTPELLDVKYPAGTLTGVPAVYCLVGDQIRFGPTPDAVYSISLDYYQRIPALASAPTNWLLTNHPSLYLSAAMAELCLYTFDDRFALWDQKYQAESKALQDADDTSLRSGSAMRVRTV